MRKRNLFIIQFKHWSYDQYDSFLVSADDREECREIVNKEYPPALFAECNWIGGYTIDKIGETSKAKGILMSSYNAG